MPKRIPFGPATYESGSKKGTARTLAFKTKISPDNAGGLPVDGKVVSVEVSPASFNGLEFESADEVRQYAGEHLEDFLLKAANAAASSAIRNKITGEFRKLELAPSDVEAFINEIANSVTPESIFTPTVRGGKTSAVKQELASIQAMGSELSKEDILARIAQLLG